MRASVAFWRQRWQHWLLSRHRIRLGVLRDHEPRPLRLPRRYERCRPPARPPLISIVTPSYNQGPFLERTLRSVLDQGYPRLEYVVQDGGSTDESTALLERFGPRLAHWESRRDRGQTHALNLGFPRTGGGIMAYLNSDDLLLPGSLAYVARWFERHPETDVVYGHRILIDENDAEIGRWVLPRHDDDVVAWADYIPQETLFWRRRIWDRVGAVFDESFRFAMDWDLILRFRSAGATFVRLPRFLGAFRIQTLQKTQTQIAVIGAREMARLRERCHGRPVSSDEIGRAVAPYLARHVLLDRMYRMKLIRY